jgi:hypothetical protein
MRHQTSIERLCQLAEGWSLAEERGRLQPWRGGFGHIGDDQVRADWYRRLARTIAQNPNPTTSALAEFPVGILAELTNTTPLEDGEHGPLFRDAPPALTNIKAYSTDAVLAMKQLLKPNANQPLLRHSSSSILQALCASLLHESTLSPLELKTITGGSAPQRTGIQEDTLRVTEGGTYTSSGYKGVDNVGQLRRIMANISKPRLKTHINSVLAFLADLADDEPVPLEVTAYAGRLDSPTKSLWDRFTEHNTNLKKSGAFQHYTMHNLCGPPTAFSSVFQSEAIAITYRKFSGVITIKSLMELAEALTQSIFKCWHNVDLMGSSEVGGLLKRINKEVNRQAFALRALNSRSRF